MKKEQSHCAWFSGFPLQQNEKRRALRSSKNQIDESLAEYLFTHILKYGVIILKEVAHVATLISITHIVPKFWT